MTVTGSIIAIWNQLNYFAAEAGPSWEDLINTLRPRQNGRHFPDDIFNWIFLNENV